MDEKQYRENQPGYDRDTFGEVRQEAEKPYNSYDQSFAQANSYEQNAQQASADGSGYYDTASQSKGNGFGIASMVLGILALVFFCGCINIPLAIIAIVFAAIHINRKNGSIGFAIAGIVTSVISVLLTVIMLVVFWVTGSGITSLMYADTLPFEGFTDDYEDFDDFDDFHGGSEDNSDEWYIDGYHYGNDL